MKTFKVYHADHPTFGEGAAKHFPVGFTHVADVTVATLGETFGVTNNIDSDWAAEPAPGVVPKVSHARSTSVGDVVVDPLTGPWEVCGVGFARLEPSSS